MQRQNDQALATAAPNSEHGHSAEAGCQQRLVLPVFVSSIAQAKKTKMKPADLRQPTTPEHPVIVIRNLAPSGYKKMSLRQMNKLRDVVLQNPKLCRAAFKGITKL